ncbi:MAG: hypothetical protein JNK38_08750 [Acidobacteria bacterium]|nr:hypothetical protein [Acidobacteriota bacterium]
MLNLACFVVSWPAMLFVFVVVLAFVGLIVGGIAWIFSWVLNVPSWKVLCVEAVVLALTAMAFQPMGFGGETVYLLSLAGTGICLFLLAVNWLYRRLRNPVESDTKLKPYSFCLNDD